MNILIFGAAGRQGSRLVDEALSRGHRVTAAVRDPSKVSKVHPGFRVVRADALDPASVAAAVTGHDVVINSINPVEAGDSLVRAAQALRTGLVQAGVARLLVVGGAASLETSPGHLLLEQIPAEWKWIVEAHYEALKWYQTVTDLDWAYLSPSATLEPGVRTSSWSIPPGTAGFRWKTWRWCSSTKPKHPGTTGNGSRLSSCDTLGPCGHGHGSGG